jgi:hypothetical protein
MQRQHRRRGDDGQVLTGEGGGPVYDAIGLHWGRWYLRRGNGTGIGWGSRPCGQPYSPDCDFVLITGPDSIGGGMLAHELGHYFGLGHEYVSPNNLMDDRVGAVGTSLTQTQREQIWLTLNRDRTDLFRLTCDSSATAGAVTSRVGKALSCGVASVSPPVR